MSEHSKGPELRYHDGVVCDANGRLRAVLYSDPQLLDAVLYPDRVTTERALEERDTLGRKMAAAPELVEALANLLATSGFDNAGEFRRAVLAAKAALEKAGVKP